MLGESVADPAEHSVGENILCNRLSSTSLPARNGVCCTKAMARRVGKHIKAGRQEIRTTGLASRLEPFTVVRQVYQVYMCIRRPNQYNACSFIIGK